MDTHLSSNLALISIQDLSFEEAFRQSISPISRIPTEILSKIFVDTQEPIEPPFPDDMDVHTRFIISWVSRYWRDTGLATPNLWTTIYKKGRHTADDIEVEIAQELLVRCRSRPISIHLLNPKPALLEIFVSQMHRIRSMKLLSVKTDIAFNRLLSQPALALSSFELVNTQLPKRPMFAGIHPLLNRLILVNADFEMPSSLVTPNLSVLHIIKNSPSMQLQDLFGLFYTLENLTELSLLPPFNIVGDHIIPPVERMHLPRLESLTIAGGQPWAFYLLEWLDIPQCSITVTCPENAICSGIPLVDSVFLENLDIYHDAVGFPIHHMKVERHFPSLSVDISSAPLLHRHSYQLLEQELAERDVESFFDLFSSDRCPLESLSTNVFPPDALEDLSRSTSLKNMTLSGMSALNDFLVRFDIYFDFEEMRFPALKELTICRIKHGAGKFLTLEETLSGRSKVNFRLDTLTFVDCPNVDAGLFTEWVDTISIVN